MKQPLPESTNEDWKEGDVNVVDLNSLENIFCSQHEVRLNIPLREGVCERCGYGFRFMIHDIEINKDDLIIRSKQYKLKIKSYVENR